MSAEAGGESDTPKRRGRIPQSAWPHILERHRSGVTLSAIAREFDCTPSAISYIVRKAEAAGVTPAASGGSAAEPTSPTPEDGEPGPAEMPADTPSAPSSAESAPPPAEAGAPPEPATEPAAPEPVAPPAEAVDQRPRETGRREIRSGTIRSGTHLRSGSRRENREQADPAEQRQPVDDAATAEQPAERQPAAQAPVQATAQPAATQAPRSEPIDAVEARLRDTARSCLVAYRGWRTQPNETTIQSLSDTMHDLRKALARIEIDISATRRDEQAQRPIPIPAHRAARRPR